MKYFMPNWEDRLDPDFDFKNDCFSPKRTSPADDVYAHNIFRIPPYDGILMSLNIFGEKIQVNGSTEIKGYEGKTIKDYLKIDKQKLEVICDCGAFSYIEEKEPPKQYSVEYICKIYETLKFDYGVSVDHLMNKNLTPEENEARRILSIKNAKNFLQYWEKNKFSFTPIGSAQGTDIKTYKDSVKKLIEMGYKYIGLGSLIPRKDEFIIELLKEIQEIIKKGKIKIHLFGVLRRDKINDFKRLGVTSFDSASYLRKAWLRSSNNYLGIDLNWYSAVRVPILDEIIINKNGFKKGMNLKKLKKDETEVLKMLHEYDKGNEKLINEILERLIQYDKILVRTSESVEKFVDKYRLVLESKIWKKCNCEMCKESGIDIIIFRRSNRNKRRGFHNTWVFYNKYLK